MTTQEFRDWLGERTHEQAAALLAASQPEVTRWANGKRRIPRRIARIIELLTAE